MTTARRKGKNTVTTAIPSGRVRVQLDFSAQAFEKLQELKELTDARSNAEVIRKALEIYAWFARKKRENFTFQVSKDDKLTEVNLL